LEAGYRDNGGIVSNTTAANRCRRTREVGAETAWLNDRRGKFGFLIQGRRFAISDFKFLPKQLRYLS
jgi:hypothetical protein